MDSKMMEMLLKIVEKLGAMVAHSWDILLKQALIVGVLELIYILLAVCAVRVAYKFVLRRTSPRRLKSGKYKEPTWSGENASLAWIFFVFFVLCIVFAVSDSFDNGVTALLNPEYWALKHII